MASMADSVNKKASLRREAGVIGLLYASLGGIIGSGWLLGPRQAAIMAGPLSIFAWVFGGVAILLLAVVYAELATMFPRGGAVVHFPHYSHGSFLARIWSWVLFLGYVAIAPVEVVAVMSYTNSIPRIHTILPPLIQPVNGVVTGFGFIICIALLVIFTIINLFGIRWAMRVSNAAGWWKLAIPALTVVVLLIQSHHTQNLKITAADWPRDFRGIFTSLATAGVIFSFLGFRQAVELAGESSNPSRNIPIAVVGSVAIGLVLYVFLQLAFLLAINPQALHQYGWAGLAKIPDFGGRTGPFAAIAETLGLTWLAWLLYADAIVSPSGTGFIYTTTSARVISAMGESRLLPKALSRLNRAGVPWLASFVSLIVGAIFLMPLPSWSRLVAYISSVMTLSYGIGPVVLLSLRRTLPPESRHRPFRLPYAGILAPLSFVVSNLIIYWGGLTENTLFFGLIATMLLVFLLYRLAFDRPGFWALPWKNTWWVLPYFGGLWLLDYIGSPSMAGGLGYLRFPYDVVIVALFSLIILYIAVNSAVPVEELQAYIDSL
jgi:amino acid transporter